MAAIAVVGSAHRIQPLAVAGAESHAADTPDEVIAAWQGLGPDVAVLVLTAEAALALGRRVEDRRDLLVTVLP